MNSNNDHPPQTDSSTTTDPPVLAPPAGEDGGMSIHFELSKEDLISLAIFHSRPIPEARRKQISAIVLVFVILATPLAIFAMAPISRPLFIGLTVGWSSLIIWMCFIIPWPFLRRRREKQLRKSLDKTYNEDCYSRICGPCQIVVSPDFLNISGTLGGSSRRWVAIEKFVVTDVALYVLQSPDAWIIVPRRAFNSEGHFQTFVHTILQYHARGGERKPAAAVRVPTNWSNAWTLNQNGFKLN